MKYNQDNLFIRFGYIPYNEKSGIYNNNKLQIGVEDGVSCYRFNKYSNIYKIELPSFNSSNINTLNRLLDMCCKKSPIFLIEGDLIGYGRDNEPLVRNVKIIKELMLDSEGNIFGLM